MILSTAMMFSFACGDDGEQLTPDAQPDAPDQPDAPPGLTYNDVSVTMDSMDPHVDQLMEFRLVSGEDVLVARGLLDTLPAANYKFSMPMSVPDDGTTYRVDFYSDLTGDRAYSGTPDDHAWRLPVDSDLLTFSHNVDFQDINDPAITEGQDFSLTLNGLDPHVDQYFELRVVATEGNNVVGVYVKPQLADPGSVIAIPGILEPGAEYNIDFYSDFNGNGMYDAPPTDHAWRITVTAQAAGITTDFAHNTDFTDVGF
jgi:hypothetical protein